MPRNGRIFPTTDDLLSTWAPLVGGKTGHTSGAGWSEAAAAAKSGVTVYGTVLGSETRDARNDALKELLSYGLAQLPARADDRPEPRLRAGRDRLRPPRGRARRTDAARSARVLARHAARRAGRRTRRPSRCPSRKGQRLGRVEVYDGIRLVASSKLVAAEAVPTRAPREGDLARERDRRQPLGDRHVIVTVTANAALDRTLTVPVFQIGFRHRSSEVAHARRRQGDQRRARAEDPRGAGRRDRPRRGAGRERGSSRS